MRIPSEQRQHINDFLKKNLTVAAPINFVIKFSIFYENDTMAKAGRHRIVRNHKNRRPLLFVYSGESLHHFPG
ncbi:hypothetical protein D3C77_632590 [compost metagenome]